MTGRRTVDPGVPAGGDRETASAGVDAARLGAAQRLRLECAGCQLVGAAVAERPAGWPGGGRPAHSPNAYDNATCQTHALLLAPSWSSRRCQPPAGARPLAELLILIAT